MKTQPWAIEMPLPPNMANGRVHWRAKDKARKEYIAKAHLHLMAQKIRRPWKVSPAKVRITAHIVVGGQMDVDNLFARVKWALDYLVSDKILRGDSPNHIEWGAIPTQEVSRKKAYTVTFTLTPLLQPVET